MYDVACLSEASLLQRATGRLRAGFRDRNGRTVLDRLRQESCLKLRFPRADQAEWTTAVTLNTSGGVAGGDDLESTFQIGSGARVTIAAQAAERFYRALPGSAPARVRTRITIAENAAVEWLPQDTILFDGSAVDRALEIELSASAWFLGVESLVFGRAAMGERVQQGRLHDVIRIHRDGGLILHEAVHLDGAVHAMLQRPAIAAGAGAAATLVHVAAAAEAFLEPIRRAFAGADVEWGASAWNGMLVARLLAPESAMLRRAMCAALGILRAPRPLPRVWLC